ncbi:MAG: hypothetical protein EBR86_14910 [Planctomycetia bacterium]|nr:hypothetical protein [Planctomycetia bacterium]
MASHHDKDKAGFDAAVAEIKTQLVNAGSTQVQTSAELPQVAARIRIDLHASADCGEGRTLFSTCTKITTNTTPCDKTNGTAQHVHLDIDAILAQVRDKLVAAHAVPGAHQLIGVVGKVRLDLVGECACGETVTAKTSCTKLTTNMSPCDKTLKAGVMNASLDLDELLADIKRKLS